MQEKCKYSLSAEQNGGQRWHSALEAGDGAALQPLAQLVDALGGIGASPEPIKAAKVIPSETAKRVQECKMSRGDE